MYNNRDSTIIYSEKQQQKLSAINETNLVVNNNYHDYWVFTAHHVIIKNS